MLQTYSLVVGSCRAYIKTAAAYLHRNGAGPNLHHVLNNPPMKKLWADATKTSAGLVKRAAIVGRSFLHQGIALARKSGTPIDFQHATGLVISFCYLLRYSEFGGDGDAARAGPLRANDISFYTQVTGSRQERALVPRHLGHLASTVALRIKGSKTDGGAQGNVRCCAQPDAGFAVDLAGMLAAATAAAEKRDGEAGVLLWHVTYASYDSFLKRVASSLHLDPASYTSHSGRRSGASTMAAAGLQDQARRFGRWNSDTWHLYVEECVHLCEGTSNAMLENYTFLLPG